MVFNIIASKFMAGIENHQKRTAPVTLSNDLGLIGVVIIGLVALVYYKAKKAYSS